MRSSIRRLVPVLGLSLGLSTLVPGCTSTTAPPTEEEPDDDPAEGPNEGIRGVAFVLEMERSLS